MKIRSNLDPVSVDESVIISTRFRNIPQNWTQEIKKLTSSVPLLEYDPGSAEVSAKYYSP